MGKMTAVTKIEKEMIEALRRATPATLNAAVKMAKCLRAQYPDEKKPAPEARVSSPLRLVRTA